MKKDYNFSQSKRDVIEPLPTTKARITIRLLEEIVRRVVREELEQVAELRLVA